MKEYTCICGKVFTDPQSFNGHKQGCKTHLINKYGDLDSYYSKKNAKSTERGISVSRTASQKRVAQLEKWINEKHQCERCGKVMTELYGSGRFCSRYCANSRSHTDTTKALISNSVRSSVSYVKAQERKKLEYISTLETRYCSICGRELPLESKRVTCSTECLSEAFRRNAKNNKIGGPSKNSSYGKRGTYKGIHCDSTYELAVLIYCLDHNIDIERNQRKFSYTYQGKIHNYYPDFYLPSYDIFLEVKGRDIGPVYEKAQGVIDSGNNISILHYEDIEDCFRYVCDTYNVRCSIHENNLFILYDKV